MFCWPWIKNQVTHVFKVWHLVTLGTQTIINTTFYIFHFCFFLESFTIVIFISNAAVWQGVAFLSVVTLSQIKDSVETKDLTINCCVSGEQISLQGFLHCRAPTQSWWGQVENFSKWEYQKWFLVYLQTHNGKFVLSTTKITMYSVLYRLFSTIFEAIKSNIILILL